MKEQKKNTRSQLPGWLLKELAVRPLPDPEVAEPYRYMKADFFKCLDQMANAPKDMKDHENRK